MRRPLLVLLALLVLGLAAGCGGDDAPDAAPTSASATTATEDASGDDVFAYDASAPLRYRDLGRVNKGSKLQVRNVVFAGAGDKVPFPDPATAPSLAHQQPAYRGIPGFGGFAALGWAPAPLWTLAGGVALGRQIRGAAPRFVLKGGGTDSSTVLVPEAWFGQAQLTIGRAL